MGSEVYIGIKIGVKKNDSLEHVKSYLLGAKFPVIRDQRVISREIRSLVLPLFFLPLPRRGRQTRHRVYDGADDPFRHRDARPINLAVALPVVMTELNRTTNGTIAESRRESVRAGHRENVHRRVWSSSSRGGDELGLCVTKIYA